VRGGGDGERDHHAAAVSVEIGTRRRTGCLPVPGHAGRQPGVPQGSPCFATYTADAAIAPTDNQGNRSELSRQRFNSQCVSEVLEQQPDFTSNELGTFLVDVTDPTRPTTVSFIPIREASHDQAVHPTTRAGGCRT
jgi:hypothetical protein